MTDVPNTVTRRLGRDVLTVLPAWLTARALVAAAYVAARVVTDRFEQPTAALHDGLLAWDGTWYRDIAAIGYHGLDREGVRFFPTFPLIGRLLGGPLGVEGPMLVVVANLAALGLALLVLRLVRSEGRSEGAAVRAVWFTMLFPSAFVLTWGYAEALMLCGAVGAFLGARQGRWWWAAAAGLLAATCRPLGVVLMLPMAIEAVRAWPTSPARARLAAAVAVVAPAVGTGAYLVWVRASYGDALLPFTVQEELRGAAVNPFTRIWEGVGDLVGPERFGQGLHVPFALLFVALLVVTFRRWPVSYGAYAAGVLVLALSADNLNSLERYGLNAFPLILTLGLLTADDRVERPALALSAAGLTSLASLAWLAAYVP